MGASLGSFGENGNTCKDSDFNVLSTRYPHGVCYVGPISPMEKHIMNFLSQEYDRDTTSFISFDGMNVNDDSLVAIARFFCCKENRSHRAQLFLNLHDNYITDAAVSDLICMLDANPNMFVDVSHNFLKKNNFETIHSEAVDRIAIRISDRADLIKRLECPHNIEYFFKHVAESSVSAQHEDSQQRRPSAQVIADADGELPMNSGGLSLKALHAPPERKIEWLHLLTPGRIRNCQISINSIEHTIFDLYPDVRAISVDAHPKKGTSHLALVLYVVEDEDERKRPVYPPRLRDLEVVVQKFKWQGLLASDYV
eukprot:GILK01003912.1.p1 GENE.GILK01003912.1~~GILK01003912.1.p1  ORF type:complete len:311 (-),score=34.96 GILK01003912.1:405-1337(-)